MENEAKASKSNGTDFNTNWGTIKAKHFYKAQEAISKGEDVSLVSEHRASKQTTIRGDEIKDWGLDINSLLVKNEVELYEREIL